MSSLFQYIMAKEDKNKRMPSGIAGLTMYYEESPETLKLKPEQVIGIIVAIIIFEVFLHTMMV